MSAKEHDDTGPAEPAEAAGPAPEPDTRTEAEANALDPRAEIEKLTRERDEYLDDLKRERAAFMNHKRWVARERESWENAAVCRFLERLVPFIDDMDRALAASRQASDLEALREGIEMICSRFRETLKASDVEEIPSTGEPFDPRYHEAILQVEDADHPPGTILETTHRGYRLKDRLIRPSRVVVSRAPQAAAGAAAAGEAETTPSESGDGERDDDRPPDEEEGDQ
jgi:molecular chaperone GrpE